MPRIKKSQIGLNLSKQFYSINNGITHCYDAQKSLEAWYRFENGSENIDSSTKLRSGTNNNITSQTSSPFLRTNKNASSGQFNGTSSFLLLDHSAVNDILFRTKPISFSFWVNVSSYAYHKILSLGDTGNFPIDVFQQGNYLTLADSGFASGVRLKSWYWDAQHTTGTWHNITITYDRTVLHGALTAYFDGNLMSASLDLDIGATPASAGGSAAIGVELTAGAPSATPHYLSGKIAEFGIWSSILTSEQTLALFYASKRLYQDRSGVITNPERVLLSEKDNATGSYPSIARTGDQDFSGVYNVSFDDSSTINFVGGNQTYPVLLPQSSKWLNKDVATPNILQGLVAPATSLKGVSDVHVSFTPGQSISAFNESKIFIDNDSAFYQTGTDSAVLPGFNQKLSSKTILEFDTNPAISTDIFWSTGTLPHTTSFANSSLGLAAGINSGLAYFNWLDKRWEVIGDLTTGSNVDFGCESNVTSSNSMLAVIPSYYYATNVVGDFSPVAKMSSLPSVHSGFPNATKFNATGSQLLSVNTSLTAPFLLEKVSLAFSASLSTFSVGTDYGLNDCNNFAFFLMTQKKKLVPKIFSEVSKEYQFGSIINNENSFSTDSERKIIWFGRVGRYFTQDIPTTSALKVHYPQTYEACDLWIGNDDASNYRQEKTGNYILTAPVMIAGNSGDARISLIRDSYQTRTWTTGKGGRSPNNDGSLGDGRSFIGSVAGNQLSGTVDSGIPGIPYQFFKTVTQISPFVLMPDDQIILGIAYQTASTFGGGLNSEKTISEMKVRLLPGESRLTLFGSLLRDNLPVSPETNQPLTTPGIHEDLHNLIFDQFDVEPFGSLTGSYIDNIITGSMFATPYNDPIPQNVRKVQGSVVAGQAGSTGSLQRFVSLVANNEIYIDSKAENFTGSNGAKQQKIGNYGYTESRNKQGSIKVRRDHHGQFRDMLEQGKEAVFSATGIGIANQPITIGFFARTKKDGTTSGSIVPEMTHSQNLSAAATSSMPYFDGFTVDRSDDPDVSLS